MVVLAITSQAIARSFWKTQDSSIYPFCRISLTVTLSLHASLCSLLGRFQVLNLVDEEGEIAAEFRFIFERFCSLLD